MNIEQQLFIQCLRDFLHGSPTAVQESFDQEALCKYAKEQDLSAIIYRQMRIAPLKSAFYAQAVRYNEIQRLQKELDNAFASIEHFYVKGLEVAAYYPVPELRTMGDLDVYVHLDDRELAHQALTKMGFSLESKWGEWSYYRGNKCVELHTAILYQYSENSSNEKQISFFNNFWSYVKDDNLDFSFHVLYLFLHLRRHIMESAVGLRQFMDIAAVTMNGADVNWSWVLQQAESLDLLPFVKKVFSFNLKCFNVWPPMDCDVISEEDADKMCSRLFSDGLFGICNKENEGNQLLNRGMRGKGKTNFRFFWEHFFLPYGRMIQLDGFSWLINRPFLLPVAWVYRGILRLGSFKTVRKRYFVTNRDLQTRKKYLKLWEIE